MNLKPLLLLAFIGSSPIMAQQEVFLDYSLRPLERMELPEKNERIEKRTAQTAWYQWEDGRVVTQSSSRPIHYWSEDQWKKITNDYDVIDGDLIFSHQSVPYGFIQKRWVEFDYYGKEKFRYIPLIQDVEFEDQSGSRFEADRGNIKQELIFRENSVKSNIWLKNLAAVQEGEFTIFEEEFELPEGAEIKTIEGMGKLEAQGWKGKLQVVSKEGRNLGTIGGALCIDQAQHFYLALYRWEKLISGRWRLTTQIENTWLLDPARQFPVQIDPLVTGPTTIWGGANIPSCFMPQYNVDSIAVTIPGGITVTSFSVGASYYADPFTFAWMSDGSMYFSTACGQSEEFTVTGANANLAGTAYLVDYNMRNPLMCCYNPQCQDQSFYLRFHLGRSFMNNGCNANYIYYDMLTQYPFMAYVEGRTLETHGNEWTVPTAAHCSNECELVGTMRMRYGVPPYNIAHPWLASDVQAGTLTPCFMGNVNKQVSLWLPDCPSFCIAPTTLTVPPPIVTDACGSTITGLSEYSITLNPSPGVSVSPMDSVVCDNQEFEIVLSTCAPGAVVTCIGNGLLHYGTFTDQWDVTGNVAATIQYYTIADYEGCQSDTVWSNIIIQPTPNAQFTYTPTDLLINTPILLADQSSTFGGNVQSIMWELGNGDSANGDSLIYSFQVSGTYEVCEAMITEYGCAATSCQDITVLPVTTEPTNIITPNGDNNNDALAFKNLLGYPGMQIKIYNRWGLEVYHSDNYQNDWKADGLPTGTYYYILIINQEQTLQSDVLVVRE